jgi:large subunit ribosomal protein L25
MTATANLGARQRDERGKNAARVLRRSGRVPAIVYGHGDENTSLSLDAFELTKLLSSISVANTLVDLEVEGGETLRTLIREVQWHPYKPAVLHVDFMQIHAGQKLTLNVPVRLVGTPAGVANEGGVLDVVLHELHVECLPRDIPEVIEVDVSEMNIGDVLRVHDVSAPNATILNDGELAICSVHAPTVAALPEAAEAEDTIGGEVEPELVRKSRGDEETPDVAE